MTPPTRTDDDVTRLIARLSLHAHDNRIRVIADLGKRQLVEIVRTGLGPGEVDMQTVHMALDELVWRCPA